MRAPKLTRKRALLALLALAALAVVAAAVAAWVINGTGDGRAKVGSLTAPTIASPASFSGSSNLLPGGTGDVQVLITNSNTVPLTITGFNTTAGTFSTSVPVGCPASSLTAQTGTVAVPQVVPAGASALPVVLKNAIGLIASASTSCQGADITIAGGVTVAFTT